MDEADPSITFSFISMGALMLHPFYLEMMCYKKSGMHPLKAAITCSEKRLL